MRVINYLMSGPAHLPYLVCSLWTLRNHYDGAVEVYGYPSCMPYIEQIAEDKHLGIEAKLWEPEYAEKNSQFVTKILISQIRGPSCRMYLDADTTIHGPLDDVFECAEESGMCITQFNDWVSTGRVIRRRVERLREYPEIDQEAVERVLSTSYPSPNGGIFACKPESPVLPLWHRWSMIAVKVFICDEAVLHLMPAIFNEDELQVLRGGKFNCSHKHGGTKVEDPYVYHYHGNSAVRPQKSPEAVEYWMGIWRQCIDLNVGNVQNWRHKIHNKHMAELKGDPRYGDLV